MLDILYSKKSPYKRQYLSMSQEICLATLEKSGKLKYAQNNSKHV